MRVTTDVRVTGGAVGLVAWLTPERALMIQDVCCEERQELVAVDVADGRAVARRPLGGTIQRVARTPRELVLLVSPARDVGPARLVVVDAWGAIRSVALERIPAGVRMVSAEEHRVQLSIPGLTVDPAARRAFVAGADVLAEVDLASLGVSYPELRTSASVLSRLFQWLEPTAYAKGANGPIRTALWLGSNLLAVTGSDEELVRGRSSIRAAGLSLVDTRAWTVRTIDPGAAEVRVAGDTLLTTGSSWESGAREPDAIGLIGYGMDGRKRFEFFDGRAVWVRHVHAGRAYVDVSRSRPPGSSLRVVDVGSGRTARPRAQRIPWLVLEPGSGRWDG